MGTLDPRVDSYIANSADFVQPVLEHLRDLVHRGCPEVQETIKWRFPNFEYKGLLCNMAAFKQHCSFGFWKAPLLKNSSDLVTADATGMGHLGKIRSLEDLPSDRFLLSCIKDAVSLNKRGIKLQARKKPVRLLTLPDDLNIALQENETARKIFSTFAVSYKNDYIEWICAARMDTTRQKRLDTAIQWISEGKRRNWKYETKSGGSQ